MTEPVVVGATHAAHLLPAVARALGASAHAARIERFPDGEVAVEIRAGDVRIGRRDVFVLQSLAAPAGEAALELLLLADAARRAGARSVSAVIPYFAYARQDRVRAEGEALGAKVMARVVDLGGFAHVVAVDLHSAAVAAAGEAPLLHVTAMPLLVEAVRPIAAKDAVVVAPDLGAVKLAERFARALGVPLAVVHKIRLGPTEVRSEGVVGDVAGKEPIIVDDMIATGGTIEAAVLALHGAGCTRRPLVVASHGLFAGDAPARLAALHPSRVVVTDSLACAPRVAASLHALEVVSLAGLVADAIRALHRKEPAGALLSHA